MRNNRSIKWKIGIPTVGTFIIGVAIVLISTILIFSNALSTLSSNYAKESGYKYANLVKGTMEGLVSLTRGFAINLQNTLKEQPDLRSREDVLATLELLTLDKHNNSVGSYIMFEPNAFDLMDIKYRNTNLGNDSGRFAKHILNVNGKSVVSDIPNEYYNQAFYTVPKQTGEAYISSTYKYESNGAVTNVVAAAVPMTDASGKFLGVIGIEIPNKVIEDIVSQAKLYETGYMYIITHEGVLAYHPKSEDILKSIDEVYTEDAAGALKKALSTGEVGQMEYKSIITGKPAQLTIVPVAVGDQGARWAIGAIIPNEELDATNNLCILIGIIISLILTAIALVLILFLITKTTKPINRMVSIADNMVQTGDISTNINSNDIPNDEIGMVLISFVKLSDMMNEWVETMKKVSVGDFSVTLTERSAKDEFSKSMNSMISSNKAYVNNISSVMNSLSMGNLDVSVDMDYKGDFAPIKESVNATLYRLKTYIQEVGRVLQLISEGNLSEKIDMEFIGDFNALKEAINDTVIIQNRFIKNISGVMGKLEKGDLSAKVDVEYKGDYQPIKTSINATVASIKSYIEEITRILSAMANGDLTVKTKIDFRGDYSVLGTSLNQILDSLNMTLSNINETANQVAMGANQISMAAQNLSHGAIQQAGSIEQLSATTSEIAEQVKANSDNAETAINISEHAIIDVEAGNQKMAEMVEAMDKINNSSKEIAKIIKTIEDIAFQTNLLALNAAVEAARAGQAGKGFSVVADEVRSLSIRSTEAAKSTTELIETAIAAVQSGNQIATETAQTLNQIVDGTKNTGSLVEKIAVATKEQAEGTDQINIGITQISEVIQSNSATAEESAASSQELSSQAQILKQLINDFKLR